MSRVLEIVSRSPEETLRLGRDIGRCLRGGEVLAINGDLGAGKTCLVRGVAQGLDIDPDLIYSPSFTLVAEHRGRMWLNHVDLFRLGVPLGAAESEEIGLSDYLKPQGVTAVEWYSKLETKPGPEGLEVSIGIEEANRRRIRICVEGQRGEEILRGLEALGWGRVECSK